MFTGLQVYRFTGLQVMNHSDLYIHILDFYRCNDTISVDVESTDPEEEEDDLNDADLYTKENQRLIAKSAPMLVKLFGRTSGAVGGKSITVNMTSFKPFFYIEIPPSWGVTECKLFLKEIKGQVGGAYRHLPIGEVKGVYVKRKPFTEFTGEDKFPFIKFIFNNYEVYESYKYRFSKPIKIYGLNGNREHLYQRYESNIDPIIKFIHGLCTAYQLNDQVNSDSVWSRWIKLKAGDYTIVEQRKRTTTTEMEVIMDWRKVEPIDLTGEMPCHRICAFDIEADSSAGGFPLAIKNYQKLAQDLITTYNKHASEGMGRGKIFISRAKDIIHKLLELAFHPNYCGSIPPSQQSNSVNHIAVHSMSDLRDSRDSHDGLIKLRVFMENEISRLTKIKDAQFMRDPEGVLALYFEMSNDDRLRDTYTLGRIYTKEQKLPRAKELASVLDKTVEVLYACYQWTTSKRLPLKSLIYYTKADDINQDHFVGCLTGLYDRTFPLVCGDRVIQIGSTFQIMGQKDIYYKHIITLDTCDAINNDEMITAENGGIYLPPADLAKELINLQFSTERVGNVKELTKEIETVWTKEQRQEACNNVAKSRADKQRETDVARVKVESYKTEEEVLLAWQRLMMEEDPDVLIGYNIFGFDFKFMYNRADQLGIRDKFCKVSRLKNHISPLLDLKLDSAAYGNNKMELIEMIGRTCIDLYKVMQREYQLDSYKLDSVCSKFLYKEKVDVSPQEIFIAQRGDARDRQRVAVYCLVDCILCNRLITKLDILNNTLAMANVCKIPYHYVFSRGQGIKVASLSSYVCNEEGYLLPHNDVEEDDGQGYEGAFVKVPTRGIYLNTCTTVVDFNSLYPSSLISENMSHDTYVSIGGKYDNLEGYTYSDITFDEYEKLRDPKKPKSKTLIKTKIGTKTCRYVQVIGKGTMGIIPKILVHLLKQRKMAKKLMEQASDNPFKYALLNGLQLAFKVVSNSVYGSIGSPTNLIFKRDIAASTTCVGRQQIFFAQDFVLKEYNNKEVVLGEYETMGDDGNLTQYCGMKVFVIKSKVVYIDTDSLFIQFDIRVDGKKPERLDGIFIAIALGKQSAKLVSVQLKKPQNLDFEKVVDPLILINKKMYTGHYYTKMGKDEYDFKSMGIVLRRRDNSKIVKHIYGGAVKIIMKEHDIDKAFDFVMSECKKLLKCEFPIEMFTTSKTLKGFYKWPQRVAHKVLADRQATRDPGNKFASNERVPYVYIIPPKNIKKEANGKILQGNKIETPKFVLDNKLQIDYMHYLTNQVQIPVSQIFELEPKYKHISRSFEQLIHETRNERVGIKSFDDIFIPSTIKYKSFKELMAEVESTDLEHCSIEQCSIEQCSIEHCSIADDPILETALEFDSENEDHPDDLEYESIFD